MATYVCLLTFTDTGIQNLRTTTTRAEAFAERIKRKGITILETLWTVGQYDLIHIFEAEDERAAAAFAFTLSSLGHVRTNTMRAYGIEEMKELVEEVQTPYDLIREGV